MDHSPCGPDPDFFHHLECLSVGLHDVQNQGELACNGQLQLCLKCSNLQLELQASVSLQAPGTIQSEFPNTDEAWFSGIELPAEELELGTELLWGQGRDGPGMEADGTGQPLERLTESSLGSPALGIHPGQDGMVYACSAGPPPGVCGVLLQIQVAMGIDHFYRRFSLRWRAENL